MHNSLTLDWSVFCLSTVTFGVFVVGAGLFFDVQKVALRSRFFAAGFIFAACSTLYCQAMYSSSSRVLQVAGGVLDVAAIVLFLFTANINKEKKLTAIHSSDLPQHLVVKGPYALVRHPFYTAYILAFLAAALASRHSVPWFCAALSMAHYFGAARQEEKKFSRSDFADGYEGYRARTGMFLPNLVALFRKRSQRD